MSLLEREGDIQLHWAQRGEGPAVLVLCHWSGFPPVFEPLIDQLVGDHRVLTYDARGTGGSTRKGPYDLATAEADLVAVLEAAGQPAVLVAMNDACIVSTRVAAARPDLVTAVVAPGTVPVPRSALAGTDALVSSDAVVEGFLDMLSNDYRGAQRTMMSIANTQMSEDEVRERVDLQVAYCPAEVAIARVREWVAADPLAAARRCGDRLLILSSPSMAGPWFPPPDQVKELIGRLLPDAQFEEVADGVVSRPDLTAAVVRRATLT